ncbi:MAG: aminotransferase class I/II-fold pyridoxal phosphate-dependent enzyme [Acidimicrobiales bacterium]
MYTKLLSELAVRATARDATSIAQALGAMVSEEVLRPGDKLPPIRTVAATLSVSSSTVAEAWSIMRAYRMIDTDRRRGTTIRAKPRSARKRYWRVPTAPGTLRLDLSTGTPDPLLLPPIEPILARIQSTLEVTSYLDPPVLSPLETELRARWPYEPEAIAVLDGANDCLDRVIAATIKLGDLVVVEDPTYPLLLDLLELAGADIIGVPLDDEGPILQPLALALAQKPVAMFLQTGTQNPTGVAFSQRRADAIAALVAPTKTLLIEDEHAGASSASDVVSTGTILGPQVVRIHSFSKTLRARPSYRSAGWTRRPDTRNQPTATTRTWLDEPTASTSPS